LKKNVKCHELIIVMWRIDTQVIKFSKKLCKCMQTFKKFNILIQIVVNKYQNALTLPHIKIFEWKITIKLYLIKQLAQHSILKR
jgi:hypothetical protein